MITIGIDPGKSGGIVFIDEDKIIEMYKCHKQSKRWQKY